MKYGRCATAGTPTARPVLQSSARYVREIINHLCRTPLCRPTRWTTDDTNSASCLVRSAVRFSILSAFIRVLLPHRTNIHL